MRAGSFTILPVAGSRYVRVSVVVVRDSAAGADDIGADDGTLEVEGDAGAVDVVPGLVVDGAGVVLAGRSDVVAGRSGFVVC